MIAYPEMVTRIRMTFTNPGQFVWHCHVLEHENNEMMRPFRVGPPQPGQP
ncbi:Multicopper oxidase [Tessaracoccus flavus]|nr:multicopper oxidase domain-containing protein [Tessaracoccus flavus]SDY69137.1 Multicopper oxidase [Tessaracoccus flavus]